MWVDMCKKLQETMHVHVRHLSQDSIFYFFPIFFQKSGCGLSASSAYLISVFRLDLCRFLTIDYASRVSRCPQDPLLNSS